MNLFYSLPTGLLLLCHISTLFACPKSLDYSFKTLASEEEVRLCEAYADKVILVVNTASKCGYTYQYDGLEALYEKYREQGLVVLGFPSNDFGQQEPGSEEKIQAFCRLTYSIKFPMMEKTHVKQGKANPFFEHLAKSTGSYPGWNFHKYLIDRDGKVVSTFNSKVEPQGPELVQAIEALLK